LSPKRYAIDQRTKVAAKESRHRSSHMKGNAFTIDVGETRIHGQRSGSGPPILLLHGFPQTHVMWWQVAELLAERFTVICADLRGYGQSGCPPSPPDHSAYSKRAMARDMVEVMARLGFPRFHLAGHDRGGRVAHRLALDHPQSVASLAVLDVIPILDVWEFADRRITEFWPFSLLAQPEPLPERLILGAPDAVVDDALRNWGSPAGCFASEARDAYIKVLRYPAHVHAICEEYRAAATVDVEHDRADRASGKRIDCPVLVLWNGRGALEHWYKNIGGPLAIWRRWANDVHGAPMNGGHFFPEELPLETAQRLSEFSLASIADISA
jgi:haloacetate dehalogenase